MSYDEFNLQNDFEKDNRYIVTISSDESDDGNQSRKRGKWRRTTLTNIRLQSPVKHQPTEKSLSDEIEHIISNSQQTWYSVSTKLAAKTMVDIMSTEYYRKKRKHDGNSLMDKQKNDEFLIKQVLKEIIYDTVLQNVYPHPFIPCFQSDYPGFFNFYIYGCTSALRKLESLNYKCSSNIIPNLDFHFKILPTSPYQRSFNIIKLIETALVKRLNPIEKKMDLSNFAMDPSIKDIIYLPVWYMANQRILAAKIKDLMITSSIKDLDLSYNSIRNFNGFNAGVTFSFVKTLNVSHNVVPHMKFITPFHGVLATKLTLEFNPLCQNYIHKDDYIDSVKVIFPTVQVLDGHVICGERVPKPVKNFCFDKDSIPIVGKFMEIFFTLFDSEERSNLTNIYSKDALFSLSCQNCDTFLLENDKSLFKEQCQNKSDSTYQSKSCLHKNILHKRSRNLLEQNSNIFIGPRSIIGCFCWIPPTEHDPMSFCVDVVCYSHTSIVLNITGLFKIPSKSIGEIEPAFEFMRSFILNLEDDEYKVSNDMLHVNSDITLSPNTFRLAVRNSDKITLTPTDNLSEESQGSLIEILMKLTTLSHADAEICLKENKWNFQLAIKRAIIFIKEKY